MGSTFLAVPPHSGQTVILLDLICFICYFSRLTGVGGREAWTAGEAVMHGCTPSALLLTSHLGPRPSPYWETKSPPSLCWEREYLSLLQTWCTHLCSAELPAPTALSFLCFRLHQNDVGSFYCGMKWGGCSHTVHMVAVTLKKAGCGTLFPLLL